jgi:hypothetical protein
MARLAALVPRPRVNLIRYDGMVTTIFCIRTLIRILKAHPILS